MEQWNNITDIENEEEYDDEEDLDVPIDVDTDFPDNFNTFVHAHLTNTEDLYININTNKKIKIDIYQSNDAYVCVHETNTDDIHFFMSEINIKHENEGEQDDDDDDYIIAQIHTISKKIDFLAQSDKQIDSKAENKIPIQISAHMINRNRMCIKIYNPLAFNIYVEKQRLPLKQYMTAREYREAATIQKNNLYKFKDFDQFWLMLSTFKTEYISSIAILSEEQYSLYNMICYIYIGDYFNTSQLINRKNCSLNNLVCTISQTYIKEKDTDEDIDENDDNETEEIDPSMNHFKGFYVTCTRQLKKFFNLIFQSESGFDQLCKDINHKFNICDYGFISYLLSAKTYYDFDNFVKGNFNEVSPCFYNKIYIGLRLMTITHNIALKEEDLQTLFKERFKYAR